MTGPAESIDAHILRLTAENFGGCKLIARRVGVSHMFVVRCWKRHGIDRARLLARNELIVQHQDLARSIARGVAAGLPVHMRADLEGVALAALTEVAAGFDPSKGVPFGAFVRQRIRGACLDSVRRRHYVNATASEYTAEKHDDRKDHALDQETTLIEREAKAARRAKAVGIIAQLPGRLAVVLWLHYMEGQTLETIAPKLGVVSSRLSQLHREGLQILKAKLGEKA